MAKKISPIPVEKLATLMRRAIYNNWDCVLVGNAPEFVRKHFERMSNPIVGDLVIEASTLGMANRDDLDGIGLLEEIAWEKVPFDGPWDEAVEGQPHPTEKCFYIRTLDGRRFRWTNARIIAALTTMRSFS